MMEIGAELVRMLLNPELYRGVLAVFAEFSRSMAAALLTALWQGVLIAAFLGICLRFAPRISAGLRFLMLAGGFVAVAVLPFLPAVLRWMTRGMGEAAAAGGSVAGASVTGAAHPWLMMDARWSLAITLVWIAASVWRAVDLTVHSVRLRRLWKSAVPVAASPIALPKLRGRKAVELCTTEELERPSVIGFLAPRILIPSWLMERMTTAELEQIVLHESEHLRRGDDWTNLLQKLSLVLFPLNPALVWMERRLCLEREMACDEGVVRRTRAPRAYAACLTSLAEHGLERRVQALSLGAWQRRSELARRVHSLLTRKPVLRPAAAGGMVVALGCGLVAGSAELARCPQMIAFVTPAIPARVASGHAASGRMASGIVSQPALVVNAALEGDRVLRPEMHGNFAMNGRALRATELRATMQAQTVGLPFPRQRKAAEIQDGVVRSTERGKAQFPALRPAPSAAKETLLREEARNLSPELNAPREESQSWVVMTTWEQTVSAPAPMMSDTAEAEGGDSAQPGDGGTQVTVTRLIWRVEPARADVDPKANAGQVKAVPADIRQPMPAIVPVHGGWLIFRL